MSRTRSPFTDLLALFASEEKISLRRARDLRKNNDPRWTRFANLRATQAASGVAASAVSLLPGVEEYTLSMTSLEESLTGAIRTQALTYRHLEKCIAAGDETRINTALKINLDATEGRLKIEKLLKEHRESVGALVSMDLVRTIINRTIEPLVAALDGVPASLAQRCNPSSPRLAEIAIRDAINDLKKLAQSALTSVDQTHLNK